ncbi:MAG TPA: TonB family protein [Terriglobales bacterium]|nr:TonB family protein [Terriglobales bacterium]
MRESYRPVPDDDLSFSQSLNALSTLTDVSLAAEIALDVALYELLQHACAAAVATSAAIGLVQNGEIVCRARTGESAPDLGMRLDWHSKLSAACFESKECQRCDDAHQDSRVDGELCRRLGIRSILLIPIMRGQELIGILEVLSPLPHAFSDHEAGVLSMFLQQIVDKLEWTKRIQASGGNLDLAMQPRKGGREPVAQASTPDHNGGAGEIKVRDFSSNILLVSLVLLATTLGWMLDRSEWHARHAAKTHPRVSQAQVGTPAPRVSSNAAAGTNPYADLTLDSHATDGDEANGDLKVFRDGKEIFRMPAGTSPLPEGIGGEIQPATEKEVTRAPLTISPLVAEQHIVNRVEPVYPQAARMGGTQGSVVLDVWVGREGAVYKLAPISGNPQLVAAASAAVRQWRFRPLVHEGQAEDFRTRVTVNFRLP